MTVYEIMNPAHTNKMSFNTMPEQIRSTRIIMRNYIINQTLNYQVTMDKDQISINDNQLTLYQLDQMTDSLKETYYDLINYGYSHKESLLRSNLMCYAMIKGDEGLYYDGIRDLLQAVVLRVFNTNKVLAENYEVVKNRIRIVDKKNSVRVPSSCRMIDQTNFEKLIDKLHDINR